MASQPWTRSEIDALRILVSEGCNNKSIAGALNRSVSAVETMKYRLNIGHNTKRRTAP